jgi:hypothetical protein
VLVVLERAGLLDRLVERSSLFGASACSIVEDILEPEAGDAGWAGRRPVEAIWLL